MNSCLPCMLCIQWQCYWGWCQQDCREQQVQWTTRQQYQATRSTRKRRHPHSICSSLTTFRMLLEYHCVRFPSGIAHNAEIRHSTRFQLVRGGREADRISQKVDGGWVCCEIECIHEGLAVMMKRAKTLHLHIQ